jgi:hypothetical protein
MNNVTTKGFLNTGGSSQSFRSLPAFFISLSALRLRRRFSKSRSFFFSTFSFCLCSSSSFKVSFLKKTQSYIQYNGNVITKSIFSYFALRAANLDIAAFTLTSASSN